MIKTNLIKFVIFSAFTALLINILGCKQIAANTAINHDWTRLTIDEEDQRTVITINNRDDTSDVKLNDYGSFFTGYHKPKVDSLKTYFTTAEKDTIFNLVEDIISKPISKHSGCTEFVGDIELTVYFGGYKEPGSCKQSIAYSGVCNWDSLSNKTELLAALLKRKIKFKSR